MNALVDAFDLVLFDLDGVIYRGPDGVPHASEVIDALTNRGVSCAYVTNNASRAPEVVAEHLVSLGVPATVDHVVTSPQAAVELLQKRVPAGASVFVVGGEGIDQILANAGFIPVRDPAVSCVALIQGFGPQVGWADLAMASDLLRGNPHMVWVATNLDRTFPTPTGIAPGNGMLVAAVSEASGRLPDLVAGKPAPALLRTAVHRFKAAAPLMVGDRLDTDIAGAHAAGMPSCFVATGVHGVKELLAASPTERPTYLGDDLRVLLEPYPHVRADAQGAHAGSVEVHASGDTLSWESDASPVDLLRAVCAWVWWRADNGSGLTQAQLDGVARRVVTHYGEHEGKV